MLTLLATILVSTAFGQQFYQDPVTGQLFEMRPVTTAAQTVPMLTQTPIGPAMCALGPRGKRLICDPVTTQAAPTRVGATVIEQRIVVDQMPVASNFPAYGVQQTAPIIIAQQPDDTMRIAGALNTRDFDLVLDLEFPEPKPKRKTTVQAVHYHNEQACSRRH